MKLQKRPEGVEEILGQHSRIIERAPKQGVFILRHSPLEVAFTVIMP